MSRLYLSGALSLAALVALGVGTGFTQDPAPLDPQRGPALQRFASDAEFQRYLRTLSERRREVMNDSSADIAVSAAAPPAEAQQAAGEAGNPEITNNQTVGVDEGGIVKQIGNHLVILQDGRLFSADLGSGEGAPLRLADRIDVYRSSATAASWYDEMLVLGDRILVTAYNYREQASEITVIRMDPSGHMTREGRFLLSSNDYYSTENYATRLVGDQLVLYAPLALDAGPRGDFRWPRLRRADRDGEADEGEALIGPTDVYAPPGEVEYPVLHTISICPLREDMDCRTTAFIGPPMREFYVSPTDAFLWIGAPDGLPWDIDYANGRRNSCRAGESWQDGEDQAALLYRLPLNGAAVGAVAVDGIPSDQFAFDSRDGRFRALLSRPGAGCVKPDEARSLALLDIPHSAFGTRIRHVADQAYASVPPIEAGELENRFVGNWLVYGGRTGWYGNSRPIFTRGRIFALMGTDLVEGRMDRGRIAELARLDLTAEPWGRGRRASR